MPRGELAIVLHSHMPYVESGGPWPDPRNPPYGPSWEGFGTWPFGEEWLWEAIVTSYLPLLDVLRRAPLTLSLTPVLCDQLEAPGAMARCVRFLEEVRTESHRLDIDALRRAGADAEASALERSAQDYVAAAQRLKTLRGGLLGALGEHVSWTSAATHSVLPLLASDAGIALQLQTGIASHRRRFGAWRGGFWLPECAYTPWLDELLLLAGVSSTCVELTGCWGPGDARHMQPLATQAGPVLWPIDRQTVSLVWSKTGYPSHRAYRNHHALTPHHHRVWGNDGKPYDADRAVAQAKIHAGEFVARAIERLSGGGVCVCALDTELLGHWWYEGAQWLGAVVDAAGQQGLGLTTLDDALDHHEPVSAPPELPVTSWGEGGDLRTWSGAAVADLAFAARRAELHALALGATPPERALRELLALQSSDWAFMAYRQTAGEYPRERATAHGEAFERALAGEAAEPALRNLAPEVAGWS